LYRIEEIKNKILCGDALEVLKEIPNNSIDLVLTDPPFMISQEIKIHRASNLKYKGNDINLDFGEWDKQWGSEEDYLKWCQKWLKECVRVLKPYKHLLFFFDNKKISCVSDFLEKLGMKRRNPLFWIKSNPAPRGRKVDFMKSVEMCLWFTKEKVKQEYFNYHLGQQKDYILASIPQNPRYHPTQKPEKPLKVWIDYLTNKGDIVLDPFAGSCTTAAVAKKLGRNYIMIEINPEYCEVGRKRLEKIPSPLPLGEE